MQLSRLNNSVLKANKNSKTKLDTEICSRNKEEPRKFNLPNKIVKKETMFSAFRKGEKFKDHFETGIYVCAKCDYELFSR